MTNLQSQTNASIRSKRRKNIFLLGSQDEYKILKTWTENNSNNRYHLNGWYHDKNIPATAHDLIERYDSLAGNNSVDHFVLDPSDMDPHMLQASINWAESRGSRIHLIQSDSTLLTSKLNKTNRFGPFSSVALRQEPLSKLHNNLFKSIFDKIFALFISVTILWWLIPIVGLFIKLNSRGPILILQERVGINGQSYKCYKFRTMISNVNAEKGYGEITNKNDKRITFVGKFLRRSNIDELPQFLNVLKGDMSVIGPRPNPIKEDVEIADKIANYRIRRFVKPGITGLAAVRGFRGSTKNMELMQKRINVDIEYIENWTFWLDVKIAAITFWQMLTFKTGAH